MCSIRFPTITSMQRSRTESPNHRFEMAGPRHHQPCRRGFRSTAIVVAFAGSSVRRNQSRQTSGTSHVRSFPSCSAHRRRSFRPIGAFVPRVAVRPTRGSRTGHSHIFPLRPRFLLSFAEGSAYAPHAAFLRVRRFFPSPGTWRGLAVARKRASKGVRRRTPSLGDGVPMNPNLVPFHPSIETDGTGIGPPLGQIPETIDPFRSHRLVSSRSDPFDLKPGNRKGGGLQRNAWVFPRNRAHQDREARVAAVGEDRRGRLGGEPCGEESNLRIYPGSSKDGEVDESRADRSDRDREREGALPSSRGEDRHVARAEVGGPWTHVRLLRSSKSQWLAGIGVCELVRSPCETCTFPVRSRGCFVGSPFDGFWMWFFAVTCVRTCPVQGPRFHPDRSNLVPSNFIGTQGNLPFLRPRSCSVAPCPVPTRSAGVGFGSGPVEETPIHPPFLPGWKGFLPLWRSVGAGTRSDAPTPPSSAGNGGTVELLQVVMGQHG